MKEIAVDEAKTQLSELLAEVEPGKQVTITRRGLPVAQLVPIVARQRGEVGHSQHVTAIFSRLATRRRGVMLGGELKALHAAGRD